MAIDTDTKDVVADCKGCEIFDVVNDLGLCPTCVEKLERDLIRSRDWECSVTAFGVAREKREALRDEIIASHGAKMELIAEQTGDKKGRKGKGKKQKRSGRKR